MGTKPINEIDTPNDKRCVNPGCEYEHPRATVPGRGLCQHCYGNFSNAIKRGETTWKKLERAGVCKVMKTFTERSMEKAKSAKKRSAKSN